MRQQSLPDSNEDCKSDSLLLGRPSAHWRRNRRLVHLTESCPAPALVVQEAANHLCSKKQPSCRPALAAAALQTALALQHAPLGFPDNSGSGQGRMVCRGPTCCSHGSMFSLKCTLCTESAL